MSQASVDPKFLSAIFKVTDAASNVAWVLCPDSNRPLILNRLASAVLSEQLSMAGVLAQWRSRVHPDDQRMVLEVLQQATEPGRLCSITLRVLRADTGRYGWFECVFSPIARAGQVTTQWVARAADIDGRIKHEGEMRDASHRKDRFIALLGHELRNPLAPIRTSLALIRASHPSGAILREVELIERQTSQMVRLINDLLDVSRLDHDRLTLTPERFDLRTSVLGVQETMLRARDDMHERLTLSLPESPVMVMADKVRIKQVLGNLMRNAVTYSGPTSPLSLSLSVTADQEALITLTDAGIGIEPERLETIFEPFSRDPEGVRRPNEGLGLGLTLARRLVQMHGGRLEAHSAGLGHGSSFTIRLPLDAQAVSDLCASAVSGHTLAEASSGDAVEHRALRILVVDDNVRAADSLTLLLQHWGHAARAAYDGHRALELDQTLRPDVVILDIAMPDMTGYDLARTLRDRQGRRKLSIIVVSGYPQTAQADPSSLTLFDHYLMKPVDLDRFRQVIETCTAQPA